MATPMTPAVSPRPSPCVTYGREVRRAAPGSVEVVRDANNQPSRLGHGGNKGSCVYLVRVNGRARALKTCALGYSELSFCAAVQQHLDASSSPTSAPPASRPLRADGLDALAAPLFVVDKRSFASPEDMGVVVPAALLVRLKDAADPSTVLLGIVMPLYDCSLQRLLTAPSVETACRARSTPMMSSPASAAAGHSVGSWSHLDIDAAGESTATLGNEEASSCSEDDAPASAFHTRPRQRPVRSLVVIAAILDAVTRGLSCLHGRLAHTVSSAARSSNSRLDLLGRSAAAAASGDEEDDETYDETLAAVHCCGFAHQDVRADNVLLSRQGHVVLCDFELVAHVDSGNEQQLHQSPRPPRQPANKPTTAGSVDSVSEAYLLSAGSNFNGGRRLLPTAFHPPEGPNRAKGDVWLLGLLALELYSGVTPLIKASVAFDDFGDGPFLAVDPVNGIGWEALRDHVNDRVRPFPSDEAATTGRAAGYMDPAIAVYAAEKNLDAFEQLHAFSRKLEHFCARCLANNPADRADWAELVAHPLFASLRDVTGGNPAAAIRRWMASLSSSNSAASSPAAPTEATDTNTPEVAAAVVA